MKEVLPDQIGYAHQKIGTSKLQNAQVSFLHILYTRQTRIPITNYYAILSNEDTRMRISIHVLLHPVM